MWRALAALLVWSNLLSPAQAQQDAGTGPEKDAGAPARPPRGEPGGAMPDKYNNTNIEIGSVSVAAAQAACPQAGHERLICFAAGLKILLPAETWALLQLPYSVSDAKKWSNFPPMGYRDRVGLTLGDFDAEQLGIVKAMLIEASGMAANEGYDELEQILNADDYLIAETGEQGFSSSNFQIAFLGTPAATGTWELQFGGHHTAFANTYIDGQLAGATPSFRGVEPFGPFEMNGRENDPMAQEQAAFAAMLTALTSSELAAAKLDQTFTNIVVGPQKDDNFPIDREGVRAGDLTEDQKALVINAISTYAADIGPAEESEAILRRYEAELDETYIAFSGSPTMDQERDYVRIDGPSVWIEYSMQPGRSLPGIHPHSIWRDRESDYAGNAE